MILVADSGATKCDWLVASSENNDGKATTMGFSPFFHEKAFITEKILENEYLSSIAQLVKKVYYYGTGCSSPSRNQLIKDALVVAFPKAEVMVDHDLTGAAIAACMGKPGIACILGTGSNSCAYDGKDVFELVPALGHKMGDEGSGAYFGKKLLAAFLYKRLPQEIHDKLEGEYGLSKEVIFDHVYHKGHENVYFASFMKSLSDFKEGDWVQDFIYKGLDEFADIHITCYPNYKEVPVNFVGSIAYYFLSPLEKVAEKYGFTIGRIERKPIFNLAKYHLENNVEIPQTSA